MILANQTLAHISGVKLVKREMGGKMLQISSNFNLYLLYSMCPNINDAKLKFYSNFTPFLFYSWCNVYFIFILQVNLNK